MTRASASEDHAELECESSLLDSWTSYSFQSDLFTPADACRLSIGLGSSSARDIRRTITEAQALLAPGKLVKVYVTAGGRRALQGAFLIDSCEIANDADGGTQMTLSLRDRALQLIGSAADPKLYAAHDTLVSVARRAVKPWGIEVTADHVAARDLRQARVSKDKLKRLQQKARSWGIQPSLMSEKIAASIDHGTITFEDFAGAQAGRIDDASITQTAGTFPYAGPYARPKVVRTVVPLNAPMTFPFRSGITRDGNLMVVHQGIPWSGATGLSSLQIYQLKVKDIRPQSGETVWEFLDRSAKRNGLLMSMTPDGKLLFCGLLYDQHPSYHLTRRVEGDRTQNNIVSGGSRLDISDVVGDVIVYGRVKGKDVSRSAFKGYAKQADSDLVRVPYQKTLVVHDNAIKSREDAQHRAAYELGKARQGAFAISYTMRGHSDSGLFFAPDTIAQVDDEVCGIHGAYYVTARTFARSARQGPTTELKLVPKGAIVLSANATGDLA
jgi:prophage tail gpP-like protein